MDRIHRLGQKRPVKVVKLVVEDSIEDQIVALQAKKLAMTEAALSTDPDAALGKLTVEDVSTSFRIPSLDSELIQSWVSSSKCKKASAMRNASWITKDWI
jgi:DNA repair protein RAD16